MRSGQKINKGQGVEVEWEQLGAPPGIPRWSPPLQGWGGWLFMRCFPKSCGKETRLWKAAAGVMRWWVVFHTRWTCGLQLPSAQHTWLAPFLIPYHLHSALLQEFPSDDAAFFHFAGNPPSILSLIGQFFLIQHPILWHLPHLSQPSEVTCCSCFLCHGSSTAL